MSSPHKSEAPYETCDWFWYEFGQKNHWCRKKAVVKVVYKAGVVIKENKRTLRCWEHYLELEEEARKSNALQIVSARRHWK
ncbi:MAG: hypothetical protein GY832_27250 [Chloroflexi bacterium]|nr:hypothetical protein [Chloroflexota bacterium]